MGGNQSSQATNQNTGATQQQHATRPRLSNTVPSQKTRISIECDKSLLKFVYDNHPHDLITKISIYGTLSEIDTNHGKINVDVAMVSHVWFALSAHFFQTKHIITMLNGACETSVMFMCGHVYDVALCSNTVRNVAFAL